MDNIEKLQKLFEETLCEENYIKSPLDKPTRDLAKDLLISLIEDDIGLPEEIFDVDTIYKCIEINWSKTDKVYKKIILSLDGLDLKICKEVTCKCMSCPDEDIYTKHIELQDNTISKEKYNDVLAFLKNC